MTGGENRIVDLVEALPTEARKWVDEQLGPGGERLTYEQIAREVEAQWGVALGTPDIADYHGSFERHKRKLAYLIDQAEEMTRQVNGEGIELDEMAQTMVMNNIAYILARSDPDHETLTKLGRTLALLGRLAVAQGQAKIRDGQVFRDFEERIRERLRSEVAQDPDLLSRLEAIVADEAERAAAEASA